MSAAKEAYYGDPDRRPPRPEFHGKMLPPALRALPRWIAWRFAWKERDSKWTKLPLDTNEQCKKAASSTNPATWAELIAAAAAMNAAAAAAPKSVDGLGFVFNGDGVFGLDIDGCRDPGAGVLSPLALRLIADLATYTEVSPSKMGVKLVGYGTLPGRGRKFKLADGQELELYDRGRYFTLTGQRVEGTPADLTDCTTAVARLLAEFGGRKASTGDEGVPTPAPARGLTDEEIIDRITRTAKNAAEGNRLWRGDTSGHGGDDSAADLALCNLIAFYTGPDHGRIDAIFRRSGLMRDKWKRPDYSGGTIGKALEGRSDYYNPDREKPPPTTPLGKPGTDMTPSRFALTDLGNAHRLVAMHGKDIRFVHPQDQWYVWSGRQWEPDHTGEINRRGVTAVVAIFDEVKAATAAAERQMIAQHAVRSQSARAISAMIQLTRSIPGIPVKPDDLDADPWLFNCPNGTVDLRTGKLRTHRREDRLTQISPVPFDAGAKCPLWDSFLASVFPADAADPKAGGHGGLIGYVRRLLGYGLTGDIREHVLPIFWGGGSNGKSTLIETAAMVFGPSYWAAAPDGMLMMRRAESHPTELARLYRKRLVAATETDEGQRLNASLVKRLTGGDTVTARFMRQDFFEFRPTHKLLMCTNDRPRIQNGGHGIWRRVSLIPFGVKFWNPERGEAGPDHTKVDADLPNRLKDELPGILAWMVRGCLEWQKDGLCPPDEVRVATADYREQQNTIGAFLAERCDVTNRAGAETTLKDLYVAYCRWTEENGEQPFGKIRFNEAVQRENIVRGRNTDNVDVWKGLVLRKPIASVADSED